MLIVVGVILYQVFFRVKGSLMGEDAEIPTPNQTVASVQIYSRDTVELHVDYRDPFRYIKIAKNVSITPDESKRPNPVQVRSRPLPAQFQWPNVSYHGLICAFTIVFFFFFLFFFVFFLFFFFNDTATTEIYTLSLHDALPILRHLT